MIPTTYQLQLHLEGEQFVSFKSTEKINTIVNNPMLKKIMLTKFFIMNNVNEVVKNLNLRYTDFACYFIWSRQDRMWIYRKKGTVIGRLVTSHPTEGERYYLRLLLLNIKGPKSYKDLPTINGVCCTTFREAAEKNDYYNVTIT